MVMQIKNPNQFMQIKIPNEVMQIKFPNQVMQIKNNISLFINIEPEEPAYATPPPPHHPYTEITYNNRNIPAFATLPRSRMKNPLIPGGGGGGDNHQHYNEGTNFPLWRCCHDLSLKTLDRLLI